MSLAYQLLGCAMQVITGSHDKTVKLWDLRSTRPAVMNTLTYHKKSVRAMAAHPTEHTFATAGADNIKKYDTCSYRRLYVTVLEVLWSSRQPHLCRFALPDGVFLHNMLQNQSTIIESLAVNEDGILVSGGNNGTLW